MSVQRPSTKHYQSLETWLTEYVSLIEDQRIRSPGNIRARALALHILLLKIRERRLPGDWELYVRTAAMEVLVNSIVPQEVLCLFDVLLGDKKTGSVIRRAISEEVHERAEILMMMYEAEHPNASDLACARILAKEIGGGANPDNYRKQVAAARASADHQEAVRAMREILARRSGDA